MALGDHRALLLPGLLVQGALGYTAARALSIEIREQMPSRGQMAVLGGCSGLLGVLATHVRPTYLVPLVFAVFLVLLVDPAWRFIWRRRDSGGDQWGDGALNPSGPGV